MNKPQLTRVCPLCGGAMQWCGDVPIDPGTPEEMATHACDQITCTACQINVELHGLPDHPDSGDDDADFQRHLQDVADKWNGGAA
jgi:hypothetical protein